MDYTKKLLKNIPFLKHLNRDEIDYFFKSGRFTSVRRGQLVDVKKSNSVNVVIDGIFEIEASGNRDIVYLAPGSFFGFLPFVETRKKGNVRALVDSRIFLIHEDDIYRFFLIHHKALRG